MLVVRLAIEILAVVLIAGATYGTTKLFVIAPLAAEADSAENLRNFLLIPICTYILFRGYFGVLFVVSNRMVKLSQWISRLIVLLGILIVPVVLYFQTIVRDALGALYTAAYGDDINVIVERLNIPFNREVQEGIRIGMLIGAWFLLLFAVEVVFRLIFYVIFRVIKLIRP